MDFAYADKTVPFTLSPETLDWYLARGWYRMGSTVFTTHFLFFDKTPFSAIWIRMELPGFNFSKSQRKLLRKNAQLFEVASGPRIIDEEREELYRRYAADFDGRLPQRIEDSLEDYGDDCVFQTWETTVREKVSGKLVGISYFDLGDEAAASILGIYDPQLKAFSIGYYTMLLEIQTCQEKGLRYYYPGYVVPGYGRFDYKLRIGRCDYLDVRTMEWTAYEDAEVKTNGPVETMLRKLREVCRLLDPSVPAFAPRIYPLFEASLYDIWNADYFPYPYLLYLGEIAAGEHLTAVYDPRKQHFRLLYCDHMLHTQLMFNAGFLAQFDDERFFTQLISVRHEILATKDPAELTAAIVRYLENVHRL